MLRPTNPFFLCAVLLCLPLIVIFTFTAPSAVSSGDSAISPLPLAKTISSTKIENTTTTSSLPPPHQPPPTPHQPAADEAEDLSLLDLASRVDPTPKPAKKLALMFLTTAPLPFAPLWELFLAPAAPSMYNVYVHADPTGNYTPPFGGVFSNRVIPSSKPTRRNTPSLISAARRLLAHALLDDEANAMFALLSSSCIPIHSFNYTYRILMNSGRSFIEILKDEPRAYAKWAARGEEVMLPEVEYEDFRIGSQFWIVNREHAKVIVGEKKLWSKFKLPCLRRHVKVCYPEEQYFPTLLNMADRRGCTLCTLTHVDWKGSIGGHPRTYTDGEVGPELIAVLRRARPRYGYEDGEISSASMRIPQRHDPFLFARKFCPGSLHRLLEIASEAIFED